MMHNNNYVGYNQLNLPGTAVEQFECELSSHLAHKWLIIYKK